jgi:hypothetical protein
MPSGSPLRTDRAPTACRGSNPRALRDVRIVRLEFGAGGSRAAAVLCGVLTIAKIGSSRSGVVMVSGYADVRIAVEVMTLGAVTLLETSFRLDELLAHLRRALELHAARRS